MKKITSAGPGLLIGIPTLGRPIPMSWAFSFKSMNPPINYNMNVMTVNGKPVAEARNEIAAAAVEKGHKYIFFIGDDVVCPANTLKQLIFRMEQNPKIGVIGGVYCSKSDPPAPLVFKENGKGSYWDWKVGEFFPVSGLGMDCTLIRTDVLPKVKKPWFFTQDTDDFADGINNAEQWTEDLWFCKQVLEQTDYEIYCDTSIICEHWDIYSNRFYTLPTGSLPLRRLKIEDNSRKVIDIGCGPIDRTEQFPGCTLVRVDANENCNPDYRVDVRTLPFGNEEFDIVFSSHVLEHFGRDEWKRVLKEWLRVLKGDGELILCLPNIEWAFNASHSLNDRLNVLYGAQSNELDFHYNGFWPQRIEEALKEFGFKKIELKTEGYNMIINARKQ